MAAPLFATRRTLASLLSRRSRTSLPALLHHVNHQLQQHVADRFASQTRFCSSPSGYSPLNDPSPNWSYFPPNQSPLDDGLDYKHWLIGMEFDSHPTDEEMINAYVETLASVLGSEEEAKKKIYSVCTTTYRFGALISEELSNKVQDLPDVVWVKPDSYLDVPNKEYGGDLFVDGKVIPRPKYNFTNRQNTQSRPRPRYDRRRETMQVMKGEPTLSIEETSTSDQPSPAVQLGASVGENVSRGVGEGSPSA